MTRVTVMIQALVLFSVYQVCSKHFCQIFISKHELLSYLILGKIENEKTFIGIINYQSAECKRISLVYVKSLRPEVYFAILVNCHLMHNTIKYSNFFKLKIDQLNYVLNLIKIDITMDSSLRLCLYCSLTRRLVQVQRLLAATKLLTRLGKRIIRYQ